MAKNCEKRPLMEESPEITFEAQNPQGMTYK
jgi:hypothetical protein